MPSESSSNKLRGGGAGALLLRREIRRPSGGSAQLFRRPRSRGPGPVGFAAEAPWERDATAVEKSEERVGLGRPSPYGCLAIFRTSSWDMSLLWLCFTCHCVSET